MNEQPEHDRNLTRTLWPVALVPPATALMFAGYVGTRAEEAFNWTLVLLGALLGLVVFGLMLGYDTWRRGRSREATLTAPMRLIESPVVWIPPIVIIALVLTFVFNQQ